jgi:hypothetical protein
MSRNTCKELGLLSRLFLSRYSEWFFIRYDIAKTVDKFQMLSISENWNNYKSVIVLYELLDNEISR